MFVIAINTPLKHTLWQNIFIYDCKLFNTNYILKSEQNYEIIAAQW